MKYEDLGETLQSQNAVYAVLRPGRFSSKGRGNTLPVFWRWIPFAGSECRSVRPGSNMCCELPYLNIFEGHSIYRWYRCYMCSSSFFFLGADFLDRNMATQRTERLGKTGRFLKISEHQDISRLLICFSHRRAARTMQTMDETCCKVTWTGSATSEVQMDFDFVMLGNGVLKKFPAVEYWGQGLITSYYCIHSEKQFLEE